MYSHTSNDSRVKQQSDIIQEDVALSLQLGLGLSLLQDRVQLGRLHDVARNLQLARHEETLGVGLAGDELAEVLIRE